MKSISATQARVNFGELLRTVSEDDEIVVVERGGEPRAVLMSIRQYQRVQAVMEPDVRIKALDHALLVAQRIHAKRGMAPLPPPEEIIREQRSARDAELRRLR